MTLPNGSAAMASVYTDFQGLNTLKAAAHQQTTAAKREAARQFEAVFIEMMLQSMRKATPRDSLFGDSQMRLYRGLYDHQIALDMAQGQGIGLRGMIEKALGIKPQEIVPSVENPSPLAQVRSEATSPPPSASATTTAHLAPPSSELSWPPATPQEFVKTVLPYAQSAAEKIGVSPQVLIAQAALESGWGKRVPTEADGQSSFNLFGIKAGPDWQGKVAIVPTVEYHDGVAYREKARFRAYGSIQASFNDYARLITSQPRYRQALESAGDAAAYLRHLQEAGYATDPRYAQKIGDVLRNSEVLAYGGDFKNPANGTIT